MLRFLVLISLSSTLQGASVGKIIGGDETAIETVPWQVALEENGEMFCSGSIISPNFILTSAQCTRYHLASVTKIRAGSSQLQKGGVVVDVAEITWNENYDMLYRDYDVGIIRLKTPLEFSETIQQISLRKETARTDEVATVAGWGSTNFTVNEVSEILLSVEIPIVSHKICNDVYYELTTRMVCAGATGKNFCTNDDGSALVINNTQVGISSWAYGCAEEGFPAVFASIAALGDFINEVTGNEASWV